MKETKTNPKLTRNHPNPPKRLQKIRIPSNTYKIKQTPAQKKP